MSAMSFQPNINTKKEADMTDVNLTTRTREGLIQEILALRADDYEASGYPGDAADMAASEELACLRTFSGPELYRCWFVESREAQAREEEDRGCCSVCGVRGCMGGAA